MSLTNNDIHNLIVFLNRVQLSGNEAVTFVQILEKLMQMQNGEKVGEPHEHECI